jgi:hypothetical protein
LSLTPKSGKRGRYAKASKHSPYTRYYRSSGKWITIGADKYFNIFFRYQ